MLNVFRFLLEALTQARRYSCETAPKQKHAGRLGNFSTFKAAKSNLANVLKDRAIDCRQADGCNQLTVYGRYREEVLPIGIQKEIIFKKTAVDVDALDVDQDRSIRCSVDVKYCIGKGVVVSQTKGQLG